MARGLLYKDAVSIRRIPPMSQEEIVKFYVDGKMPSRFAETTEERSRRIIDGFINAPLSGIGGDLFEN